METLPIQQTLDNPARQLAMQALGVVASCRRCGAPFSPQVAESFRGGKRVKCQCCEWYGNWRDNTPLTRSTLSNLQFLAMFYKFSLPDSPAAIAAELQISPTTVREWQRRINTMMTERHLTDGE